MTKRKLVQKLQNKTRKLKKIIKVFSFKTIYAIMY